MWMTPRALEVDESYETYRQRMQSSGNPKNVGKTKPGNLSMQAKMWPTPVADGDRAVNYKQGGTSLGYAARMWATPTAVEWKGRGPNSKQQGLAEQAKMWPTPTANEDACGTPSGKMQKMLGNHPEVRNTGQGSLSADWVEQLMGYPAGWTCLDDGETDPGKTESLE